MNPIRKAVVSWKLLRAGWHLVKNPADGLNEVFQIADTLFHDQQAMVEAMVADVRKHEQGRAALASRHRLGDVSLPRLKAMPAGSLGRELGEFFTRYQLDPYSLPVRAANDEGEWLMAHLYETHDLWHVVTGFETDTAGELGLQAFYAAHLTSGKLPSVLLAIGFLNTFLYAHEDRARRLDAIARGWLLGKRMKPMLGYRWADALERPLAEVRSELGYAAAPPVLLAA